MLASLASSIFGCHCMTPWLNAMMLNIAPFGSAFTARRSSCFAISIFGPENFCGGGSGAFGASPVVAPRGGGAEVAGAFFSAFIDPLMSMMNSTLSDLTFRP